MLLLCCEQRPQRYQGMQALFETKQRLCALKEFNVWPEVLSQLQACQVDAQVCHCACVLCCCAHQIGDPEKMKAACASPRACVASFPTTTVEGMLFAWLESGPEAEKEAAAQQPYIMPEQVGSSMCSCGSLFVMRCMPVAAACGVCLCPHDTQLSRC